MNAIRKLTRKLYARTFGYCIHSHDFDGQHFACTFKEALEWAACYPADDFVCISRFTNLVAIRGL